MSNTVDSKKSNPSSKFCPDCGTAIPRVSAKFCPECGLNLETRHRHTSPRADRPNRANSNTAVILVLAIALPITAFVAFFLASTDFFSHPGSKSSDNNVVVPPPSANSYSIGFNAGKGLAAQNTSLYPNRTAMCGETFQNYAGQQLDFEKFMAGCQSGFQK